MRPSDHGYYLKIIEESGDTILFDAVSRAALPELIDRLNAAVSDPTTARVILSINRYWPKKASRQEMIDGLRALGQQLGRTPTSRDIRAASQDGNGPTTGTFILRFGSLRQAQTEAGFDANPVGFQAFHSRSDYTPPDATATVRRMSKVRGVRDDFASKRARRPVPASDETP